MTYEVNNVDLLWKQMRRDVQSQKITTTERYVTGMKINRPEDDLFGYQVADEISLNVQSSENIKSNLDYARQVGKSALNNVELFKTEVKGLHDLIMRSRGKTQNDRDKVQKDVDATLNRMGNILEDTFSGLHMLKGPAASVEIALDAKYYSDPSSVPKITVSGQDLTLPTLTINGLKVDAVEGMTSADVNKTFAKKDIKNLQRIDTALNKVNAAQADLASDVAAIETQGQLVVKKIDTLKAQYDDLIKSDRAEELAKLKALNLKEQLVSQSYGLVRGDGRNDMSNMLRRIS